jgi:signal peptidase I
VRNPVDRLTEGLPHPLRVTIDWVVTLVGAIAIVLALKAWVVNPYRIPSSSMEPTLHCARSQVDNGCEASTSDRVLANRFIFHLRRPDRGEIVVFKVPQKAATQCNVAAGDTFVKRLMGVPGDKIAISEGRVSINGRRIEEPYARPEPTENDNFTIGPGEYFMMGDNRPNSCDSRVWGTVRREALIGPVFAIYWPPGRIDIGVGATIAAAALLPLWRRRRGA